MRQLFLLIVLFFVGQWLVKSLRRADARAAQRTGNAGAADAGRASGAQAGGNSAARGPAQLAEPMIRCVECGVHAPKSDSVVVAGDAFCCADHARRHAARTGPDAR